MLMVAPVIAQENIERGGPGGRGHTLNRVRSTLRPRPAPNEIHFPHRPRPSHNGHHRDSAAVTLHLHERRSVGDNLGRVPFLRDWIDPDLALRNVWATSAVACRPAALKPETSG
jgi:hypothetical protein